MADWVQENLAPEAPGLKSGRSFHLTWKFHSNKETRVKACLEVYQDIFRCFFERWRGYIVIDRMLRRGIAVQKMFIIILKIVMKCQKNPEYRICRAK